MTRHEPDEYCEWTARYAAKRKAERDEVRVAVWVPRASAEELKRIAAQMREVARPVSGAKSPGGAARAALAEQLKGELALARRRIAELEGIESIAIKLKARVMELEESIKAAPEPSRKIGRNEPCPCGSGKKYKRCCGMSR